MALTEFALAMPLLVVLAMGILEFGMAFRATNVMERSTAAGGRIGSSIGPGPMADYEILQAVNSVMSSEGSLSIVKVVVYNSQSADGAPPPGCLSVASGGIPGVCNVYNATQAASANPASGFSRVGDPLTCAGGSWDSAWCPTTRNNNPQEGAVTYLGVHVEGETNAFTGLFVDQFNFKHQAVYRLEPPSVTAGGS